MLSLFARSRDSLDRARDANAALIRLTAYFRHIDDAVNEEFRDPHEVKRNVHVAIENDRRVGHVVYDNQYRDEFAALMIRYPGRSGDDYLSDSSFKRLWNVVFRSLSDTWSGCDPKNPGNVINRIGQLRPAATESRDLFCRANQGLALTDRVISGIEERLIALESFIQAVDEISIRRLSRAPSPPAALHTQGNQPGMGGEQRRSSQWIQALTTDGATVSIVGVVTTAAIALQVASFQERKTYDKNQYIPAKLWNYLQSAVISATSLGVTVLPLLPGGSLNHHTTLWAYFWSSLCFVCIILAPSLYYPIGPDWSSLLACAASISGLFLRLQLLKALRRADAAGNRDR